MDLSKNNYFLMFTSIQNNIQRVVYYIIISFDIESKYIYFKHSMPNL